MKHVRIEARSLQSEQTTLLKKRREGHFNHQQLNESCNYLFQVCKKQKIIFITTVVLINFQARFCRFYLSKPLKK